MTVGGTGFVPGSIVSWAGTPLSTTFHGTVQLAAQIPEGLIPSLPGLVAITVTNPAGGGTSNSYLAGVY